MTRVFLSYARADGKTAAAHLSEVLSRTGFTVWQDTRDMEGGLEWKGQLKEALRKVDAVLVLMTPAAVCSKYVEWEYEMAQMIDKRVIPLLMSECDVPDSLARLHYYNFSEESGYGLNLAGLIGDLQRLAGPDASGPDTRKPGQFDQQTGPAKVSDNFPDVQRGNRNISIGGNANNAQIIIGDGNNVSQSN